jgi:ComF family protein
MKLSLLRTIIQFIFPSHCVVCGQSPTRLHALCAEKLSLAPLSPHAWISSCYSYKDKRVATLIRHLKNKEDMELCETLGKLLASQWASHCTSIHDTLIIVPVPARGERMRTNGFNQAELLAKNLAHNIPRSLLAPHLIQRTRETTKQALIYEKSERLVNLKNVFIVNPKKKDLIQNNTVLIIDDVTTSGATLTEIKNALEASGAHSVYALTLAH